MFLCFARHDELTRAVCFIALVFAAHSVLAITLSALEPTQIAGLLPDAAEYWSKQEQWIRTGRIPNTKLSIGFRRTSASWAALSSSRLFPWACSPCGRASEVDMMNYYVGNLCMASQSHGTALVYGWHVWSVLRGIAFAVITYEVVSFSLERLCGRPLSTPAAEAGAGLGG